MTALPRTNPYHPGPWYDAYDRCLNFESTSLYMTQPEAEMRAREARILGYLVLEAPTNDSRHNIAREVSSCVNNASLSQLQIFT
jgi:hypothetical protein